MLIRGHIQSTMAVDDDSFKVLEDGREADNILEHIID